MLIERVGMLSIAPFNIESDTPIYRQIYLQIKGLIDSGRLPMGTRLPATRELAGQLGLNRTTISAAYELLESQRLITGHVGRGSFVAGQPARENGVPWRDILEPGARRLRRLRSLPLPSPDSQVRGPPNFCFRSKNFVKVARKLSRAPKRKPSCSWVRPPAIRLCAAIFWNSPVPKVWRATPTIS
jgi:DNA-binding transcriptional regulator YhcF (GntR family)